MLTKLEVINPRSDTLSLPMQDISGGYSVREITGLDPVNATLTSSAMAQLDGAQPQNAQRGTRNITLKLGLEPDFTTNGTDTVASLRRDLYSWFLTKAMVSMNFFVDQDLFVTTTGQVESFENSMFSANPEVDISIICYDPDFYAPESITVGGTTVATSVTQTVTYDGNIDAGIIFTLNVNRSIAGFTIYNTHEDGVTEQFDVVASLVSGDVVVVNTVPGSKGITLTRSGLDNSLLYAVSPSSDWITLQNGENDFRAVVSGAGIAYTIEHTPKYGAI